MQIPHDGQINLEKAEENIFDGVVRRTGYQLEAHKARKQYAYAGKTAPQRQTLLGSQQNKPLAEQPDDTEFCIPEEGKQRRERQGDESARASPHAEKDGGDLEAEADIAQRAETAACHECSCEIDGIQTVQTQSKG